jgi:hypothetical protein
MIASIFFTAPKLELAYQMASNPIQMIEPERVHSTTPLSESMVDRFGIAIVDTIFRFAANLFSHDKRRRIIKVEHLDAFL